MSSGGGDEGWVALGAVAAMACRELHHRHAVADAVGVVIRESAPVSRRRPCHAGEVYYEGKEFEVHLKEKRPGFLGASLAARHAEGAPPPWLINMQMQSSLHHIRICGWPAERAHSRVPR